MGGLERDAAAPYGWAPDTSVNNGFDADAAAYVYDWCFAQGVPMAVVSRNVVPMLPMQLAHSFAHRTNSDVMRYLADAQYLGLEGLWVKLCEGKLPARCSKRWFAETFCQSIDCSEATHVVELLGAEALIRPHLNGFVKPYDVIALMAVLPMTTHLFAPDASTRVVAADGRVVSHVLLLDVAHALDVRHVVRLLRVTYHAVMDETQAVITTGGSGARAARKDARLVQMATEQDARDSVALADAVRSELELSLGLDEKAALPADGRRSNAHSSSRAKSVAPLASRRALDAPRLAQQLADAASAERRVARAQVIAALLLAALVSVAFVTVVIAAVVAGLRRPGAERDLVWARALATVGLMAGVAAVLCLKPTDAHRRPTRAASAALAAACALGVAFWLREALSLKGVRATAGFETSRAAGAAPAVRAALELVQALAYLFGAVLLLAACALQMWAACARAERASPSARLRALWWSLRVCALAIVQVLLVDNFVCARATGCYASAAEEALNAAHAALHGALLVLLAPWSSALCARLFALVLRGRAQAPWLAPIAAFLGTGGRSPIPPLRASHDALLSFVAVQLTPSLASGLALARKPLHLTPGGDGNRSGSVSVASCSYSRRLGAQPAAQSEPAERGAAGGAYGTPPPPPPPQPAARAALGARLAASIDGLASAPWVAFARRPRGPRTRIKPFAPSHGDGDGDDDDDDGGGACDAAAVRQAPSRLYSASARIFLPRSAASSAGGGSAACSAELDVHHRHFQQPPPVRRAALAARAAAIASASAAAPADYYVVHSPLDASGPRRAALVRFATAAAAANGGTAPTVWLDELCRDPGFTSVELLAHLPFHLCRARKLLLVVGPDFAYCLRSACVLVAWRLGGGSLDDIEVCYAADSERDLALIVTSADVFHVTYTRLGHARALWPPLARVVELTRVPVFNEAVRRCLSSMRPAPGAMGARLDANRVSALRAESSAAHRSRNRTLSGSILDRFVPRHISEAAGADASAGGGGEPHGAAGPRPAFEPFIPWTSFFDGLFGKAAGVLEYPPPRDLPMPSLHRLSRIGEQSCVSGAHGESGVIGVPRSQGGSSGGGAPPPVRSGTGGGSAAAFLSLLDSPHDY